MIDSVYLALISTMNREITNIQEHLADGSAKSFDEYRHLCGVVKGLTIAIGHVKDLQQINEEEDEYGD